VNLAAAPIENAQRHPARTALRLEGAALSYGRLDDVTARVAGLLRRRGVQPGDRVGIMLPNVPHYAVVYYGALRAGAIVVPLNVLLTKREVAFHLGDAGASVVFAWHDFAEAAEAGAAEVGSDRVIVRPGEFGELVAKHDPVRDIAERDPLDTAVILYTSGTTGTPKGAELTHANLVRNVEVARELFRLDRSSVTLGALPLFHSFGQTCCLNATLAAGGAISLLPRFDAGNALATIERDRVTVLQGVPTMYNGLLNHPDRERFDVSSLRLCVSGGAPLPVELLRDFESTFGCPVIEGYGLSETSPVASFNHPGRVRKPGSIGTPVEGVEMKLVGENGAEPSPGEVGEIAIRGHNVMKGYWRRPEATAEAISPDGWFRTGDLARVDEDGYFFIVDRKKDMIIRGGYNVYPREIEEVLYANPLVAEAAVVAVPHETHGEEVKAFIALRAGAESTPDQIIAYCREHLAAYKYPRLIEFRGELPKTATGKILKRELVG
jgi:long-chain acyl-CoA synthetase